MTNFVQCKRKRIQIYHNISSHLLYWFKSYSINVTFLQTIDNIFYLNISYEQTDHENPVGVQSTLKIYVEVYEYFVEMTEDVFVKKISQGPEKYKYMTFNIMYICIYIFIWIKS